MSTIKQHHHNFRHPELPRRHAGLDPASQNATCQSSLTLHQNDTGIK